MYIVPYQYSIRYVLLCKIVWFDKIQSYLKTYQLFLKL